MQPISSEPATPPQSENVDFMAERWQKMISFCMQNVFVKEIREKQLDKVVPLNKAKHSIFLTADKVHQCTFILERDSVEPEDTLWRVRMGAARMDSDVFAWSYFFEGTYEEALAYLQDESNIPEWLTALDHFIERADSGD